MMCLVLAISILMDSLFRLLLEPSILLAFFHHTEAGFIYPCHTAIFYGTCHAALLVPVPAPID
jgi:hypothetical protein